MKTNHVFSRQLYLQFSLILTLFLTVQVAFGQDVPMPITNLSTTSADVTAVWLRWTAPVGEDGVGYVAAYDVRYSTSPITAENFEAATSAYFWRKPGSSGPIEVFPVYYLTPGTHYYFAIKSSFFLGEWSELSNVVEESTDLAPSIRVSSTSLTDSLITGETSIQNVTIYNEGPGVLEFIFQSEDHISLASEGYFFSIPSGDSITVSLQINAGGMFAGTNVASIVITSNDPVASWLTIYCSVEVTPNGFPIAVIRGNTEDFFGDVYVGGGTWPSWTYVQNAGSEPLIISDITVSSPDFRVYFEGADTLATSEEYFLLYSFGPHQTGASQGIINVVTNDPVNPVLNVTLNGTGVESPVQMVVDLEALTDELYSGQKSIQYVNIRNDGLEDLVFSISDYGLSDFIDVSPRFGTLQTGQSINLEVTFDARGVDAGSYSSEIVIENNDPRTHGVYFLPTTFDVKAPEVRNFSLTNFRTNTVVANFDNEITLDVADPNISKYTIRANVTPANSVGSVDFFLDGSHTNYDNAKPYTINSWLLPVLSGGQHAVGARGYERRDGQGNGGPFKEVTVNVINSAKVVDFDVVKSTTGEIVMDLAEGSVIDISQPNFQSINIIANASISSVKSVKFSLNGPTARIDNQAPFALKGNSTGDTFWAVNPGNYSLRAIPYMMYYGWGVEGVPLTVNFKVVNGRVPSIANARSISSSEITDEETIVETDDETWSVYPIPVRDEIHVKLNGKIDGHVHLSIMNLQGQYLHIKEGSSDIFKDYTVNTESIGMSSGFYIIQIQQAGGQRLVKKFLKE